MLRYSLSALSFLMIVLTSCEINDLSPDATTGDATVISESEAILSGIVDPKNQVTTISFEFGATINYDKTINVIPDKIGGNTDIEVNASVSGLNADSRYHYRVKAVSLCGTTYGEDRTFVTSLSGEINFNTAVEYGSVTDEDGNTYRTVKIGTQTWMAENLKTTRLNNGKPIPQVTDGDKWSNLTVPGYCWYNNDPEIFNYKAVYGALYNYFAVETGRLCPSGWHVPTEAEWYTMITFLGIYEAGGKLKEAGFNHWRRPNAGATNESGFTALPGGNRFTGGGRFSSIGNSGYWWSTFDPRTSLVWEIIIYADYQAIHSPVATKENGYSVRCVKDQ